MEDDSNTFAHPQSATSADRVPGPQGDPLEASLFGEYLRLVMLGTAACAGILWAAYTSVEPLAVVMIGACLLIVGALSTHRFAGWIRLTILLVVAGGIALTVGIRGNWLGPIPLFSPAAVLCVVAVLVSRDVVVAYRQSAHKISIRTGGIGIAVAAALAYLVIAPMTNSFLEPLEDRPTSFVVEEPTYLELLRIHSSKLLVFAIFAYFGACVGSFLNVVAASVPRGESVVIRTSKCPKCATPIRRVDNLPIISYLMLQGRCRVCEAAIPFRYLAVELIGTTIFASLFVYELVTGAANVPGFQHYHHTGILWIILYAKWPVIGIYFYHAMMFSCVLMFALMESDGLRPRKLGVAIVGVFAALAVLIPVLQPVAFDDHLPVALADGIPSWLTRAITCLMGGLVGWLIAIIAKRLGSQAPSAAALILLGVTLGWQATVTISLIWLIANVAVARLSRGQRPAWLGPTATLFVVAMLHHPAWKWTTEFW